MKRKALILLPLFALALVGCTELDSTSNGGSEGNDSTGSDNDSTSGGNDTLTATDVLSVLQGDLSLKGTLTVGSSVTSVEVHLGEDEYLFTSEDKSVHYFADENDYLYTEGYDYNADPAPMYELDSSGGYLSFSSSYSNPFSSLDESSVTLNDDEAAVNILTLGTIPFELLADTAVAASILTLTFDGSEAQTMVMQTTTTSATYSLELEFVDASTVGAGHIEKPATLDEHAMLNQAIQLVQGGNYMVTSTDYNSYYAMKLYTYTAYVTDYGLAYLSSVSDTVHGYYVAEENSTNILVPFTSSSFDSKYVVTSNTNANLEGDMSLLRAPFNVVAELFTPVVGDYDYNFAVNELLLDEYVKNELVDWSYFSQYYSSDYGYELDKGSLTISFPSDLSQVIVSIDYSNDEFSYTGVLTQTISNFDVAFPYLNVTMVDADNITWEYANETIHQSLATLFGDDYDIAYIDSTAYGVYPDGWSIYRNAENELVIYDGFILDSEGVYNLRYAYEAMLEEKEYIQESSNYLSSIYTKDNIQITITIEIGDYYDIYISFVNTSIEVSLQTTTWEDAYSGRYSTTFLALLEQLFGENYNEVLRAVAVDDGYQVEDPSRFTTDYGYINITGYYTSSSQVYNNIDKVVSTIGDGLVASGSFSLQSGGGSDATYVNSEGTLSVRIYDYYSNYAFRIVLTNLTFGS